MLTFAFIPARYGTDPPSAVRFPAASAPICGPSSPTPSCTPISCISGSILPGSSRSARRSRAASARGATCCFMLVTAAAGALAQLVSSPRRDGADDRRLGGDIRRHGGSDAIHFPAATVRSRLGETAPADGEAYRVPAAPLMRRLRDVRFLLFLGVWMGLNALFGLGAVSFGERAGTANRLAGPYRRLFRRVAVVHAPSIRSPRAANSIPSRAAETRSCDRRVAPSG